MCAGEERGRREDLVDAWCGREGGGGVFFFEGGGELVVVCLVGGLGDVLGALEGEADGGGVEGGLRGRCVAVDDQG